MVPQYITVLFCHIWFRALNLCFQILNTPIAPRDIQRSTRENWKESVTSALQSCHETMGRPRMRCDACANGREKCDGQDPCQRCTRLAISQTAWKKKCGKDKVILPKDLCVYSHCVEEHIVTGIMHHVVHQAVKDMAGAEAKILRDKRQQLDGKEKQLQLHNVVAVRSSRAGVMVSMASGTLQSVEQTVVEQQAVIDKKEETKQPHKNIKKNLGKVECLSR